VTAVGSTRGVPETAAAFSGGGFSTVFARPAYQDAPVSGYLSTIPATFAGIFSRDNRAFPDVALQGVNMEIIQGGNLVGASGTSGSAPAFAGLIALLNAELVAAGRPTLGFLNRESVQL
jgi:tripeptidyl-peptidase-1